MIKEYKKQVVQNAIAHHVLTDVQPDPKQWHSPLGQLHLVLLFFMTSCCVGYSFSQFGSAVLAVSPSSYLCIPSFHTGKAA